MSRKLFNHFLLRLWPDRDYFQVRTVDIVVYLLSMKNTWQAIKFRLGPIQFLDFTHLELAQAHLELGKQVNEQVWRNLDRRLSEIKPRRLEARIKQAREY